MRQTLLPWQQREYKGMRTSSDALDLVALPEDLLIQCLDASMKLCTRAAMTSKEMRNALVKAAGKAKGLRMLAMYPQYALKAERAGLFRVQELVLSHWFAGPTDIARLEPWFDAMPMLTVVSLPPKNDVYALQATSRLRLGSPGRPITVISRELTTEVPWKLPARALISAWLHPCGVPSPTTSPTGFATPTLFGSGDNTDDEDTVVADLIYM